MIKIKGLQSRDKSREVLSTEHRAVICCCTRRWAPAWSSISWWGIFTGYRPFSQTVQCGLISRGETQHLKSECVSLCPSESIWKSGKFGSCEANIKIFLSFGFLACLLYLRTGWGISLFITRLRFNEREMLTFALRPKTRLVLLITVGNLCPV